MEIDWKKAGLNETEAAIAQRELQKTGYVPNAKVNMSAARKLIADIESESK